MVAELKQRDSLIHLVYAATSDRASELRKQNTQCDCVINAVEMPVTPPLVPYPVTRGA